MNEQNRSLRLCEILEDEYAHLHDNSAMTSQSPTALIDMVDLVNGDELVERLAKYRTSAAMADSDKRSKTKKATLPTDLRYEKLAGWLRDADPSADALEGDALKLLIEQVFSKKLDQDLVKTEPWMLDASLRPHTRGLIKSYDKRRTWSARINEKIKHPFATAQDKALKGAKDATAIHTDNQLLNRMLLEDTFVGYVLRFDDKRLDIVFRQMYDRHQTALCLSGGGIRSATFALGVLQGLVKHKALDLFSYLSTVSGGGYLGGWLSAWINHEGLDEVAKKLNGHVGPLEPEAVPVRHLRQYSNYLSPRSGLLSTDTWTLIVTYLRNLLLVWLVIMPLLAAIAAIPWVVVTITALNWGTTERQAYGALALAIMASITSIIGTAYVHAFRPHSDATLSGQSSFRSQRKQSAFLWWCFLPLCISIFCWTLSWRLFEVSGMALDLLIGFHQSFDFSPSREPTLFSRGGYSVMLGASVLHFTGWLAGVLFRRQRRQGLRQLLEPLAILVTGAISGFLFLLTIKLLHSLSAFVGPYEVNLYTCLAFPSILLAILLAGSVFEGITSRFTEDTEREWSARYGAWFLIAATGWLTLNGLVLFGPIAAGLVKGWVSTASVGLLSGILTALLGQSSKTGGPGQKSAASASDKSPGGWPGILAQFTLPIVSFVTLVTLFITLSFLNMALMRAFCSLVDDCPVFLSSFNVAQLTTMNPTIPLVVLAVLSILVFLFGSSVDTNRLSLHAMYRSRLIRAYLGASRPPGERQPDPFTGFDETDDMPMGCVQPAATPRKVPFHIVNMALNLVAGQNLAWQERKAESFTVSPRHAGSMRLGYRRTYLYDDDGCPKPDADERYYGGDRGITLGTAMTISGAAASPNQGYHSSPLVAFLMTLFNVRLGWWLGNPGPAGDETFHKSAPTSAIWPIIDEMRGNTDDVNDYVYLSDGGHFENLGLYEMVLRRNRFIVLSDAGCDETCTLEDLGNAIRKIRIDLGAAIDFPLGFNIRSRADTSIGTGKYWAIGRIRYLNIDPSQPNATTSTTGLTDDGHYSSNDGILLYIKPGIVGNEPHDIFNYASSRKAFPHETTADQFFSESQFESYRALGTYALEQTQAELLSELGISLADLFDSTKWQACLAALNLHIGPQAVNGKPSQKLTGPMKVYVSA